MKNKIKRKIARCMLAVLFVFVCASAAFADDPSSVLTRIKTSGGSNPPAGTIKFIAYCNSDAKILTEDSLNDGNNNDGYTVPPIAGQCKTNLQQLGGTADNNGQTYYIWITYGSGSEGGHWSYTADGTATEYCPSTSTQYLASGTDYYLGSPTISSIVTGANSATIYWSSVTNATNYRVYARPAAGEGTTEVVFERKDGSGNGVTGTNYTVSGLTQGKTYYFIVASYNSSTAVLGGHSDEMMAQINPGTPEVSSLNPRSGDNTQTTGLTITGLNLSSAQIVSLEGTTNYLLNIGTNTDTQIAATVPSGCATGTYNVTVKTSSGTSPKTAANTFEVYVGAPAAPSSFSHQTAASTKEIIWTWNDNSNAEDIWNLVDSGTTVISSWAAGPWKATTGSRATTESGLVPNTYYTRKTQCFGAGGPSGYSNTNTAYTLAMGPFNCSVTGTTSNTADITWEATAGGGALPSKYYVWRAPDADKNGVADSSFSNIATVNAPTIWYHNTGLTSDYGYIYYVTSLNGDNVENTGKPSNQVPAVTLAGPPTAPSLVGAAQSTSSILWTITDNSNNEDGFAIFSGTTQMSSTLEDITGTGGTTATPESGFGANAPVIRRAGAHNVSGWSYSTPDTTAYTHAAVPTLTGVTSLSSSSMQIAWSGSGQKYSIERSDNGSWPGTTIVGTTYNSATAAATYIDSSGLTQNHQYWYKVRSWNSGQIQNPTESNIMSNWTMAGLAAPTGFSGSGESTTAIKWTWTNAAPDATNNQVINSSTGANLSGLLSGSATLWEETSGLTPCTAYSRAVRAIRNTEIATSGADTAWTYPNAPTSMNSPAQGTSEITVAWSANSNVTPTWVIERATQELGPYGVRSYNAANPYNDTGLAQGTTYWYKVKARNGETPSVESAYIGPSSFTTTTTTAALAPRIFPVRINGYPYSYGDIIPPKPLITATITDESGYGTVNYAGSPLKIIIDQGVAGKEQQIIYYTGGPIDVLEDSMNNRLVVSCHVTTALDKGPHTIRISVSDNDGHEAVWLGQVTVMGGRVQVIGTPLNYPNPFKPLSADPTLNRTRIQYTLSSDAPVMIVMYDITGQEVKRWNFSSGEDGGKAGINSVEWDGKSVFDEVVGNGMFIYKIVSGDTAIGTGKIVVLD